MFKSAPVFGIGFNGFTDQYEITAHNSFVLCLAELGILGSTLWMALLVTTTMGLNRILGGRRKRSGSKLLGLLHLFEASSLQSTTALAMGPAPAGRIDALPYTYSSQALPAMVGAGVHSSPVKIGVAPSKRVPHAWLVVMRLALISFMATAWFLSRSYTTTMYLVLGLATAAIALQQGGDRSPERGRWIVSTLVAEVLLIIVIYGLVRLRH